MTEQERQKALDAIENLFDYMLRCEIVYDSVRDDVEIIRATLQSPRVPVIDELEDALEEGVFGFENGMDFPTHLQREAVHKAARAYAELQKGK